MLAQTVKGASPEIPKRYGLFSRAITKTFRDSSKGSDHHISQKSKGSSSVSPIRFNYDEEKKKYLEDLRQSSLNRTMRSKLNIIKDTFEDDFAEDQKSKEKNPMNQT